ncbi:hypothetical protein GN956_G12925 [Arapaima gigas]
MDDFLAEEAPGPSPLLPLASGFLLTTVVDIEDLVQLSESLSFPRTADDLRISSNRTAAETLGRMRQTVQEPTVRSSQGATLPAPWDRDQLPDERPALDLGQRPPRRMAHLLQRATSHPSRQAEPGQARLSRSAPSLAESSPDSSWLLRVRGLGGRELEAEIRGQEGSPSSLCPRPLRIPRFLAPLDRGQREVTLVPVFQDPWPLKVAPLLPATLMLRTTREQRSRKGSRVLPVTWEGSNRSTSSSVNSQGSQNLEGDKCLWTVSNHEQLPNVEHPVTGPSVPSALEDCRDTGTALEPGHSAKGQRTVEKSVEESTLVIFQTRWNKGCVVLPRGAEMESPHVTAVEIPEATCHCCENDRLSHCRSSFVKADPDMANGSQELLEEDIRPEKWDEDCETREIHQDNILKTADKGQIVSSSLEAKQRVPKVDITISESDHLTEVEHNAMKTPKNKEKVCSAAHHSNQLSSAPAHNEQDQRNRKSKSNPKTTNVPAPPKAYSRRPTNVIVTGKAAVKLSVYSANVVKVSKKCSRLPSSHNEPVEALRENVKRPGDDKQILTRLEPSGQKQTVQQEVRSTWQPKRSVMAENLRAKSAAEYITYTDMFQEINSRNEGPAIYEMFATPIYENLRLSNVYEKFPNREVKSAPPRKSQGCRSNKCPKPLETKKQSKTQGGRVKNRAGVVAKGKSRRPLVSDAEQENMTVVNQHIQITEGEMVVGENYRMNEVQLTTSQHVGVSILSVIEENLSNPPSETLVIHKTTENTAPSSREVLNKPQLELLLSSRQCVEENAVATAEVQNGAQQLPGETKPSGTKHNSSKEEVTNVDPELKPRSFPAEPKLHSWTSEGCGKTMSPVFQNFLDGAGEGAVTDDLLQCLARELVSLEDGDVTLEPDSGRLCGSGSEEVKKERLLTKGSTAGGRWADDAVTWTKGEVLGRGAYGTVYCGLTSNGQLIAVKQVALDDSDPEAAESEYQRLQVEVDLLKTLRHNNIVGFLGTALQDGAVSIFMEYVPGGSIASILQRFGPLPEKVLALYTQQILEGVAYLHRNRVIHRDLKGNNVMLMPDGVIKLIDFGCARRIGRLTHGGDLSGLLKSVHGTPYWMAPEVINESGHGRKSDIWSIGCTVFEMATGKPPLAHMDKMAALFYIGARRGLMPALPDDFSEEARNFVQACLTSDQKERPSAEELLSHRFLPQRGRRRSAVDQATPTRTPVHPDRDAGSRGGTCSPEIQAS